MVVALGAVAVNAASAAIAWLADVVPGRRDPHGDRAGPVGSERIRTEIAAIDGVARATPIASFDLAFEGIARRRRRDRRLRLPRGRPADVPRRRPDGRARGARRGRLGDPARRAAARQLGVGVGDSHRRGDRRRAGRARGRGYRRAIVPGRRGRGRPRRLAGRHSAASRSRRRRLGRPLSPGRAATRLAGGRTTSRRSWRSTAAPVSSVAGRIGDALDRVFGLLDLLALAAVIVAGFGIVNTLSMDAGSGSASSACCARPA